MRIAVFVENKWKSEVFEDRIEVPMAPPLRWKKSFTLFGKNSKDFLVVVVSDAASNPRDNIQIIIGGEPRISFCFKKRWLKALNEQRRHTGNRVQDDDSLGEFISSPWRVTVLVLELEEQ